MQPMDGVRTGREIYPIVFRLIPADWLLTKI